MPVSRKSSNNGKNANYISEDDFDLPKLIPIRAQTAPPRPLTEIEEFRRSPDFLLLENTVMMSDHLKQRADEKYDLDSEDGQRACKRFLNQIERLCEVFKAFLREQAKHGRAIFSLVTDAKESHRAVAVHPADWRVQACQLAPGREVFVHMRGTYVIASASYWWSRLASSKTKAIRKLSPSLITLINPMNAPNCPIVEIINKNIQTRFLHLTKVEESMTKNQISERYDI